MDTFFKIECPKCKNILIINRITGKLLEVREPLLAETTGDRFEDALKKIKLTAQETEEKFAHSREAEKNKQKELDDLFQKSLEQAKKEKPDVKPLRDIDLE